MIYEDENNRSRWLKTRKYLYAFWVLLSEGNCNSFREAWNGGYEYGFMAAIYQPASDNIKPIIEDA